MDSVINQTLDDIEIICINDASTDNSLDILREYEQKDSRVKIINLEQNSGVSAARNKGLDAAVGEYLGFIDPDDEIDLNFHEELYKKAKEDDADIVKCSRTTIEKDGTLKKECLNDKIRKNGKYSFTHDWQTAIYRHSLIKENNICFNEDLINGEDSVFLFSLIFKTDKISLIDNVEYRYFRRNGSLNAKILPLASIESANKSLSIRMDMINESDLFEKDKNLYISLFNGRIYAMFGNTLFQNDSPEAKKMCAKWLIDTYNKCKDKELLDSVFKYKYFLYFIKKQKVNTLAKIFKRFSTKDELKSCCQKPLTKRQRKFSITKQGRYKVITLFDNQIAIKIK